MSSRTRTQIYEDLKDLRRRGELPDDPDLAPGMTRMMEVRALADRVFGDEAKAELWLIRPNASFAGQVPADLMKDDLGAAVVLEALEQIAHGIVA